MATQTAIFSTALPEAKQAGSFLGKQLREAFKGQSPDALLVFASDRYYFPDLLKAIHQTCEPKVLVGCSSAGEFTSDSFSSHSVSVLGLISTDMRFSSSAGTRIKVDYKKAANELISDFKWTEDQSGDHRYAIVFADALAGYTNAFLEEVNKLTRGRYQFFGGGAGDDGKFIQTHVFRGTEVLSNAVVALEVLSKKPFGIGARHTWTPATPAMKVTESDGSRLVSLDGVPACDVFKNYAAQTGQKFDSANALPFFLLNVLGIKQEDGYLLRVPLGVGEKGSIVFAADVPEGSTAHIMAASQSPTQAPLAAVQDALSQLGDSNPAAAIFFDCVATRLRLGDESFGVALKGLNSALKKTKYVGCNTYGQIIKSGAQFGGFHNCTAVICIIPE